MGCIFLGFPSLSHPQTQTSQICQDADFTASPPRQEVEEEEEENRKGHRYHRASSEAGRHEAVQEHSKLQRAAAATAEELWPFF